MHLHSIKTSNPQTSQLQDLEHVQNPAVKMILDKHLTVFSGMGKLKDRQFQLSMDKNVKPIAQQTRRIPFHIREKVELEL